MFSFDDFVGTVMVKHSLPVMGVGGYASSVKAVRTTAETWLKAQTGVDEPS